MESVGISRKSPNGSPWETLNQIDSVGQFRHDSWQLLCHGDMKLLDCSDHHSAHRDYMHSLKWAASNKLTHYSKMTHYRPISALFLETVPHCSLLQLERGSGSHIFYPGYYTMQKVAQTAAFLCSFLNYRSLNLDHLDDILSSSKWVSFNINQNTKKEYFLWILRG